MNKLKYLCYCLRRMDYAAAFRTVGQVAKEAKKPWLWIFADMVWCGLRYQAGRIDYQTMDFYCLTGAQRESVLTRGKSNAIVRKYNDRSLAQRLEDKGLFARLYQDYIRRDWLDLRFASEEEFRTFVEKHSEFMAKPVKGEEGYGVEKYSIEGGSDLSALYRKLREKGQEKLGEVVKQHPEMDRLYPCCVNTLRLYTFFDGSGVHLLQSVLKIGNGGSVVDNDSHGGILTFLTDDGVVKYPAQDANNRNYESHPMTGVAIVGFRVPHYEEAVELVKEAAMVTPGIAYVGWDVAITPTGPAIIEGNFFPGVYDPRGTFLKGELGCLATYRKYMDI